MKIDYSLSNDRMIHLKETINLRNLNDSQGT